MDKAPTFCDFRPINVVVKFPGGTFHNDVIWGNDIDRAKERVMQLYPEALAVEIDRSQLPNKPKTKFSKTWEVLENV